MATTTDVRKWARDKGYDVKSKGRLAPEVTAAYEAEHPPAPPAEGELGPELELGLEQAEAAAELAGTVVGPDRPAPPADRGQAEAPPRKPKSRGGLLGGLGRGKAPGTPRPKAKPRRPARPRVSLEGLIESAWSDLAWAAGPVPPMQRLLHAQAPYAGVALEDGLRDTFIDRVLQPVARAQAKGEAVGGLIFPPAALGLVLATAPVPTQTEQGPVWPEPSTEHKMALLMLRWSLMLMAKGGATHLAEYKIKAEEAAERGRSADMFMAFILGAPMPPGAEDASASDEETAVRMAAAMFGASGDDGG